MAESACRKLLTVARNVRYCSRGKLAYGSRQNNKGSINFYFFFSRKNNCTNSQIIHTFNKISATLKIGKLNKLILIKSLTPPSRILSMRLPSVPAMKNQRKIRQIFLLQKIRYIQIRTAMVMMITRNNGIGSDRATPVLNVGVIRKFVSIFWS